MAFGVFCMARTEQEEGQFKGEPYRAAGKTGTAETVDQGKKVWNVAFVGYAPYDNPEIAISVIVPSAYLKVVHRTASI